MSSRSVRRALGVGAALVVVAALASSALAGAFASGASGARGPVVRACGHPRSFRPHTGATRASTPWSRNASRAAGMSTSS